MAFARKQAPSKGSPALTALLAVILTCLAALVVWPLSRGGFGGGHAAALASCPVPPPCNCPAGAGAAAGAAAHEPAAEAAATAAARGAAGVETQPGAVEQQQQQAAAAAGAALPPWTPADLSPAEAAWALATNQLDVPSMVSPERRHLSLQLALGALLLDVPGDFVETGVAAGGTSILLLKALEAYDASRARRLWAADSFQGLPQPVEQDQGGGLLVGRAGQYAYAEEEFIGNLKNFSVWDEARVKILKGWFSDSLPSAPIERIAYLRLDGDLFVSTMDPLLNLYDKISPGGLIYVDDYGSFNGCKKAVDEFRASRGITGELTWQAAPDFGLSKYEAVWWIKQ